MTTILDEIIGWKRLSLSGVVQKFRNHLNLTGATGTDDAANDCTHVTMSASSNVVATGEFTMNGATMVAVNCAAYKLGDVVITMVVSEHAQDAIPWYVYIWPYTDGVFRVSGDPNDLSVYTYKVLR
jgi:hypothetical protein